VRMMLEEYWDGCESSRQEQNKNTHTHTHTHLRIANFIVKQEVVHS